jgi:protoheme ferro-lyase
VPTALWGTLLVACVATGAALCAALIVPRRHIWVPLAAGAVTSLGAAACVATIGVQAARADTTVAAAAIGIGAVLGGFALASSMLPSFTTAKTVVHDVDLGPDDGLVHVVVLADAEPERYSPASVTKALTDLERTDVVVPPDAARPLVYASERARYRDVGGSPARGTVRAVAAQVSALLDPEVFALPVTVAFCEGGPALAESLADAAGAGGRLAVVALLGVAGSRAFDVAAREAALGRGAAGSIDVAYTDPLWSSVAIAESVARRILEVQESDPAGENGVVLVSEGQPTEWDEDYPATSEHATYFCQRVRSELAAAGIREDLIRLAWLDWNEPGVTEVVRHLAALGCERICVLPATMPFDTVGTLLDLRSAAVQAAVGPEVHIDLLPAWGDAPEVARELSDRIGASAREVRGL